MPAATLCPKCGQHMRSQLHHCTPNRVVKWQKIKARLEAIHQK